MNYELSNAGFGGHRQKINFNLKDSLASIVIWDRLNFFWRKKEGSGAGLLCANGSFLGSVGENK